VPVATEAALMAANTCLLGISRGLREYRGVRFETRQELLPVDDAVEHIGLRANDRMLRMC
jgi:hypothetical protein